MSVIVRKACVQDLDAMVALLAWLFAQEADFRPQPELQRQALRSILQSSDSGTLLVAQDEHEIVGMLGLHYTVSTAEGGTAAWLEDLVVESKYQRQGIGHQLLQEAFAICRSRGIRRVTLLTDRTNSMAQRFYRREGFAESAMMPMRLWLT